MLTWATDGDRVRVGDRFALTFHRTLRIPDDGRAYPLPAGLGLFPVLRVADYRDRIPAAWGWDDGVFIPMYQREAVWLGFAAAPWKPNAVKVGAGRVNAVTGAAWDEGLRADPQDYLVCPPQPWLDGVNAGGGVVRQFVAVPLGRGLTVESQLAGGAEAGGLRVLVFDPRPGRFPDAPPPRPAAAPQPQAAPPAAAGGPLGVGAGGTMTQKIYPDPHALDAWDPDARGGLAVYVVNSEQYQAVTGRPPPPTPITPDVYRDHQLPWFTLYDEDRGTVAAPAALRGIRSVETLDPPAGGRPDAPGPGGG